MGIDCFGPYTVKERRTELKRWGVIYTCTYSRAVHVELLDSMSADAFINALRCFVCIRGPVSTIYCDQGTNFIGAHNELARELNSMSPKNRSYLEEHMIEFKFNAPSASHAGGMWERQIRTIKSVLNGMTNKYDTRMDSTMLRTSLYEAMATVNSRPLSTAYLNDPTELVITPNHLLTMKPHQRGPLPGNFDNQEIYGRRMWKKVQQFAEEFWSTWKTQYLANITKRQRWQKDNRNLCKGDLVLVVDEPEPRNNWRTAIVVDAPEGSDGLTRRVRIRLSSKYLDKEGKRLDPPSIIERPVQKLVLLLPNNQ